jgi:hypothetical protein
MIVSPSGPPLLWQYWGLNSGPYACCASALPLETHHQAFSFIFIYGLLLGLTSDSDPPTSTSQVAGMCVPTHSLSTFPVFEKPA